MSGEKITPLQANKIERFLMAKKTVETRKRLDLPFQRELKERNELDTWLADNLDFLLPSYQKRGER